MDLGAAGQNFRPFFPMTFMGRGQGYGSKIWILAGQIPKECEI